MYRPRHMMKRFHYRPVYADHDHPHLCFMGVMGITLGMVILFWVIAFY